MNLEMILRALQALGPVVAQAPEFVALYNEAVLTLHPKDQATAQAALQDLQQNNDMGHLRLQEKLAKLS